MRKRRNITTMDTQERYFQNSLGHPSLPTALFFLADPRALITSISRGVAYCSAAFFMPAQKEPVCGRLTSSFLPEAFRPTPVSRERSTAVSPAGPRSEGSSRKRSLAVSPIRCYHLIIAAKRLRIGVLPHERWGWDTMKNNKLFLK